MSVSPPEILKKITISLLLVAGCLLLVGFIIFKVLIPNLETHLDTIAKNNYLSIHLIDPDNGILKIENTGRLNLTIKQINIEPQQINCHYFSNPDLINLNFQLNNQAAKIYRLLNQGIQSDIYNKALSPKASLILPVFPFIIPKGIFCKNNIPIEIEVGFATDFIKKLLIWFDRDITLNRRFQVNLWYNGCDYSLKTEQTDDSSEFSKIVLYHSLLNCAAKKNTQFEKINNYIEEVSEMQQEPIRKNMTKLSNAELLEYRRLIMRRLVTKQVPDRNNTCYFYLMILDEIFARNLQELQVPAMTEFIYSCLNIDPVLPRLSTWISF